MLRTYTFLSLAVACLVLLSGCAGEPTPPTAVVVTGENPPAPATDVPTPEPTEALAALVNGEPITLAAFQTELRREETRLAEAGVMPADRSVFERSVLNGLIDQVLIEQAAAVQGLQVTPEELEAELALDVELAGGQAPWEAWLAQNDLTEPEYRDAMMSALLTAKIRDLVIASVPEQVEQAHARHILVSTQEEAQQIYEQLLGGAEFGDLALQHSRDVSTRELGGDLGWFAREQLTAPVVADVAFSLEVGQVSEPVASNLGYHIIQTLERVNDRPLDELARASLFEMTFERWRQSLWDRATIERFVAQ